MTSARSSEDLAECMSVNQEAIKYIPLRIRILALGFVQKLSLDELNRKLLENDCPRLYSRSFFESSLIYAFQNSLSYDEWRTLYAECGPLQEKLSAGKYFQEKKISFGELERYVLENSSTGSDVLGTRTVTRELEELLTGIRDEASLKDFLTRNLIAFAPVREKTRYYFCKYLYYYLNTRIEKYFKDCRRGRDDTESLSEMMALKAVTALRRKKTMPEQEKRALIRASAISCGELFDAFSYFYFDYVSMDWISILMEYYGDISEIPQQQRKSLAAVFRKKNPGWKKLSDEDVILEMQALLDAEEEQLQQDYDKDSRSRGYGRNRSGEYAVYQYIRGTLDMDRTTFICFLLFFSAGSTLPQEHILTTGRMNEILSQCGFPVLRPDSDFDGFTDEFLNSRDPMGLLMDEVVSYAKLHENSFLYHIYSGSVNYGDELKETL